ncbi:MAG: TIM barrel protein [Phycisphaera sp.]|nr:TIM barrel protein [Phycisphaera sp.]
MLGNTGLTVASAAAALGAGIDVASAAARKGVVNDRIRQSIVYWCFNMFGGKWSATKQAQIAITLGCRSIELIAPEDWPILQKYGLVCAIAPNGMPGAPFVKGLNNKKYHDEVITRTKDVIDKCEQAAFPSVIAFNGYKWNDAEDPNSGEIPRDVGAKNVVEGLKELARYAEPKGVSVHIEMLNTRDHTHPMKGHPGYQGDDIDYVADIVRAVGSPNVKILFDIYHVQIMNGDVIRRIGQYADLIGHVHTAGNPGRGELHLDQEINYAACMKALVAAKYKGFVGQEFIPTEDPMDGLTKAVNICDV